MATELRTYQGVTTASLSGFLDEVEGAQLEALIRQSVSEGGKLIIDWSGLTGLDRNGVLHLIAVQRWVAAPGRNRLPLAGFNAALWRIVVEQHAEFNFEAVPSLTEALRLYGVAPSERAARLEETETHRRKSLDELETRARPPGSTEKRRAAIDLEPPTARFPAAPPPIPMRPAPVQAKAGRPAPITRARGLLAGAALAMFALVFFIWWALGQRPPQLSVSVGEIVVEEDGREVEGVVVQVKRGRLVEPANLPGGLSFAPPPEEGANNSYLLQGAARAGARSATVELVAQSFDGSKKSDPVQLVVTVQPKPLAWQLTSLQSLPLRAGQPIRALSKFLTGSAKAPTAIGLPPGLAITVAPGSGQDWQLSGTPSAAGRYAVTFSAETSAGREEKSCVLEVAEAVPPIAPPRPPAVDPVTPPPPPNPSTQIDDGMRKFLLERIERLPVRYTQEDRENLRLVVRRLQQAKLVQRVIFEHEGQTAVSPTETAKLLAALKAADTVRLFNEKGCRIVVVGYASLTGSLSGNVRISKLRAKAVRDLMRGAIGHNADLCGDYGPTDVVDPGSPQENRVVEIYAGTMDLPEDLRRPAEHFVDDFNRRHGAR